MSKVRDHLWLWAHQEGSHNNRYGLTSLSRMTPAEAAIYMGVENLIMVVFADKPEPPFDQHAKPLFFLKNLVWSIVGDANSKRNDEKADLEEVIALSKRFPNIKGAILDDFFGQKDKHRHGLDATKGFRDRLHDNGLELWAIVYTQQLDMPLGDYIDVCDRISMWTWRAEEIAKLDENFRKLEKTAAGIPKYLGCYLWDYGDRKPMPVSAMKQQCEKGLEWLKQGRLDGIVFLASCICDLDLESVEWTKKWIASIGDLEK